MREFSNFDLLQISSTANNVFNLLVVLTTFSVTQERWSWLKGINWVCFSSDWTNLLILASLPRCTRTDSIKIFDRF